MRYRILIFYLGILILFANCANSNQYKAESRICPENQITGFVWDTQGGGDMRFVVEREGKHYKITVERYDFRTVNRIIALADKDNKAYGLVQDIFARSIDLYNYRFVQKGLTGTWTEITLIYEDRHETVINRIDATGDLNILYQFVCNALKNPACS